MRARHLIIIPIMFLALFMSSVSAYTISGDKITYEGTLGKVTQEPYLLTDMSNEVELTFTSYFTETEYLDIAFGFNLPDAQPTTALYYNPHVVYTPRSFTCEGYANYTTNPNYMWCWKNKVVDNVTMEVEHHLIFEHAFDGGDVPSKTIYWNDEEQVDYTDISNKFAKIPYEWNGKNTWYVIENVEFNSGQMKTLKLDIDVLPNTVGKYDIFIKRNVDTFNWAIANDQYILLDPWWNATYPYCRNVTVANPKSDHQSYINLTYSANMQGDFDDIRFVNTSCNNGGGALSYLLRNKTDNTWATYDLLLDGTQNISVYYGNAGVASVSSVTDVWGADLGGYWTFDIGAGTVAKDLSGNGHDGTLTGESWNATGVKGGMINFGTGRTVVVTVGDHADLESQSLTMVAWVRRNTTQNQYTRIIEKYWGAGSPFVSYNIDLYDAGGNDVPSVGLGNGGIWSTAYATVLADQVWYMLVGTFDGTNVRKYINGSIEGAPVAHAVTVAYSAGALTIGNRFGSTTVNQMNGWLDEIQFYSRNLSDTEISNMYAETEPTFTVGAEQTESAEQAPFWSLNISEYPANYDATSTTLSITWSNGSSGTVVNVSDVNITTNLTGSNVTNAVTNISGTELSGVYNLTDLVGAGTYFWYSSAGNNNSQSNTTSEWFFTIAKYASSCSIYANGLANDSNVTYPNLIIVYGTCDNPEGNWTLYKNVSVNISANNNTPSLYGVDYAFFKANVTASDNYTAASSFVAININQGNLSNVSHVNITYNVTDPTIQYNIVNITCNYPVGITQADFKLYNDTAQIGNTTAVWNASVLGTFNYTCNSTGNANWSSGSVNNTLTVAASGGLLITSVLDELTYAGITFNLTLFNDTFSSTSTNINSYNNDTVRGDLTATISADGYGTRTYYINIPVNTSYNFSGYMLEDSEGHWVSLTIKNLYEETIEDVEINMTRILPTGVEIMAQGITDSTGTYAFFLDNSYDYGINLTHVDYISKSTSLIPVLTAYNIYLEKDFYSQPSYWEYYKQLTVSCSGFDNTTRNVNCSWADTSGHLDTVFLVVREMNLTQSWELCNLNSSSSSGSLNCTLPAANNMTYTGVLYATFSSDPTMQSLWGGVLHDLVIISFLTTGIIAAIIIIFITGFIGIASGSPILTVIGTLVGVGFSYILGFLTMTESSGFAVVGLIVAGVILIVKMRE